MLTVSSEEDANSVSDDEAPAPAEGEQTANGATEDADADGNEAAAQEEDETCTYIILQQFHVSNWHEGRRVSKLFVLLYKRECFR